MAKRMTIELSDKMERVISELLANEELDLTSKADAIRNAIALYSFVAQELKTADRRFGIADSKGKLIKEIVMT